MNDRSFDASDESFDDIPKNFRSQSAIPRHSTNAQRKYVQYLKKLQEKNRSVKDKSAKEDLLKQRENGFQLYINGAHHGPSQRPSTAVRKKVDDQYHRIKTPAPILSEFLIPTLSTTNKRTDSYHERGRWMPTNQTKIHTEQGSIVADVDCQISHLHMNHKKSSHEKRTLINHHTVHNESSPVVINQMTYRLDVDESWMPNWYKNINSKNENSDLNEDFPFSLNDISITNELTQSQQKTYRLSSPVGKPV